MKKIFCLILIVSVLFCSCQSTLDEEEWGSFTPEKTYSYDGNFYAVQDVDSSDIIVVSIYSSDDELVYSFQPARAWDFWGICWERDTYNIWIQSGDIGVYCYVYKDGKWVIDHSAIRPDYIVSKYDNYTGVGEVIYYDDYSVYVE